MPPVIVIGSPRGGTSAVAGVLQILGFDMGNTWKGYNEDPELRFSAHTPVDIAKVVAKRMQSGKPWGWKDALVAQYIEDAITVFPDNSRYVYVTRDPKRITDSMFRHEPYPKRTPEEMLRQNQHWQTQVVELMKQRPGFCIGDFDEFRANSAATIDKLADWVGGDKDQLARAKRYIAHNTYIDPADVS